MSPKPAFRSTGGTETQRFEGEDASTSHMRTSSRLCVSVSPVNSTVICCVRLVLLALAVICAWSAEPRRIEVGNLTYAGDKTSVCFSDRFLTTVKAEAGIDAATRMRGVRLADPADLASVPFVVMNGQEPFRLTPEERANLKTWLSTGGFLLASAGCSSQQWNASFTTEMEQIFGSGCLAEIGLDHAIFKTLFPISAAPLSHGGTASFWSACSPRRVSTTPPTPRAAAAVAATR